QRGNLIATRSTDLGQTWSAPVVVAPIQFHNVGSGILVEGAKPTVRSDGQGTIYAVWSDCRFRPNCASDDLVMTSSTDGVAWSPVSRIPLDQTSPLVDHYLPGLGVDPNTAGSSAHLAVIYYFNDSACSAPCAQI